MNLPSFLNSAVANNPILGLKHTEIKFSNPINGSIFLFHRYLIVF